ncbi:15865_t:CDS:2 [Funneliformis geosporum]|uniref:17080_t:CDS:1 n=1 Tax=Funneliformis geosporum TaxID=1117311 RepID=A0A9W4SF90_9GLOM|nr:15865_t:CDS:2 [Funneliformis geosporum]CAI2164956.1 17080_t:CDS:2 [Funneliformis geosporum]
MGVPGFFKWLSLRYPHIVETVKKTPRSKTDFLYLDINALFHVAIRNKKFSKKPKTPRRVLSKVFKEMDTAFSVCEPQILVYIAMDGVAPRAKMNEQRSRRYLAQTNQGSSDSSNISTSESFDDNSLKANHEKGSGFFVPVDSVAISAGTSFMQSANDAIKFYIYQRLNGKAKSLQVIFNDSSVAGEGEHKVFQFLNAQRKEPGYNSKFRHIVCGGDADFIMYALLTHEPNLRILRPGTNGDDVVLNINRLRKHILHDMVAPQLTAEINEENIIEDFVCIVNLLGNDFLPRLTHLGETRVDLLFRAYRNYFNKYRTYITNKGGFINMEQFLSFIKFIGERKFYTSSSTSNLKPAPVSEVATRANDYMKTICWALQYYSGDCPSWKFYYPHHKPPSIEEILKHVHAEGFDQTFNADTPMRPFEQLMCIIPPVCHYLLPEPFHDLLTDPKSPIIEYYPTKFSSSNCKAILPFIDEKVLSQAMEPRSSLLSPEDARRNDVNGYVNIYSGKNSTTYPTIYSLCMARGGNSVFPANSVVFGQLFYGGPMRISIVSPINEWRNIYRNSVVNAEYRLPNFLGDSSGYSNSEERPNANVGFFTNQHRSLFQGNASINSTSQFRNDGTVLLGNASNLRNFTTTSLRSHTSIPSECQNVIFQSQVQNRTRPVDGRYFVDQNVTLN